MEIHVRHDVFIQGGLGPELILRAITGLKEKLMGSAQEVKDAIAAERAEVQAISEPVVPATT